MSPFYHDVDCDSSDWSCFPGIFSFWEYQHGAEQREVIKEVIENVCLNNFYKALLTTDTTEGTVFDTS